MKRPQWKYKVQLQRKHLYETRSFRVVYLHTAQRKHI